MHVCIVIHAVIPAHLYGGSERVVHWLGKGLVERGHRVTYLAKPGSTCDFAAVLPYTPTLPLEAQLPDGVDFVHVHSGHLLPGDVPSCLTLHGNVDGEITFPQNTVFVSQNHAHNHNGTVFVHNGLDPADYGDPGLTASRRHLAFLAKAAWKVKNVRGAIRVARRAGQRLEVVGGHRLNLKMGVRLTLDWNARFHGLLGGEAKNRVLRVAAGLLFPVLWPEPFGIAAIEAMYFGLPVFATPYGALPELVTPDAGVLSNSVGALAIAASRPDAFNRRAIHAHCMARFTYRQMTERYLALYTQILDGEPLHAQPVHASAVRQNGLLPWLP